MPELRLKSPSNGRERKRDVDGGSIEERHREIEKETKGGASDDTNNAPDEAETLVRNAPANAPTHQST